MPSPFDRTEEVCRHISTMSEDAEARSRQRFADRQIPTFEAGIQHGLLAAKLLIGGLTVAETWARVDELAKLWAEVQREAENTYE